MNKVPLINISHREQEVLELISVGFTTRQIAKQLCLSNHTIVSHRKNLISKVGARNMPSLVRRSYELGLFENR